MEFFNLTQNEPCKSLVVLTTDQLHYIAGVILKTDIFIDKKHVSAPIFFKTMRYFDGFFFFLLLDRCQRRQGGRLSPKKNKIFTVKIIVCFFLSILSSEYEQNKTK